MRCDYSVPGSLQLYVLGLGGMTNVVWEVYMSDTNVSATGLDGQEGGSGSKYITLLLCSVFEIQRSKSIIAGGLWNYIFFHNLFSL